MTYKTIVCDPPWDYKNPGEFTTGPTPEARGAGSNARYGRMDLEVLSSLVPPASEDAHLYLWTTNAFICEAHTIAREWGFRPITLCTWVKTTHDSACEHGYPKVSARAGYYFRGATEHCLFAVKGKATPKFGEVHPTAWLWPRLPHSQKPEAFFDMVERVSPGPYLEMFARRNRLGWHTWGDEALEHVHPHGDGWEQVPLPL